MHAHKPSLRTPNSNHITQSRNRTFLCWNTRPMGVQRCQPKVPKPKMHREGKFVVSNLLLCKQDKCLLSWYHSDLDAENTCTDRFDHTFLAHCSHSGSMESQRETSVASGGSRERFGSYYCQGSNCAVDQRTPIGKGVLVLHVTVALVSTSNGPK